MKKREAAEIALKGLYVDFAEGGNGIAPFS